MHTEHPELTTERLQELLTGPLIDQLRELLALLESARAGLPESFRSRLADHLDATYLEVIASRPTLSFNEAVIYLNTCRETLRQRVRAGDIPARKWGKKLVFKRADLDTFLDTLPNAPTGAAK